MAYYLAINDPKEAIKFAQMTMTAWSERLSRMIIIRNFFLKTVLLLQALS